MKTLSRIVGFGTLALLVLSLVGPAAAQAQDFYRVRMSAPGASGIVTDCSAEAYVLALSGMGGKALHSTGAELDADGSPGPDLLLDLVTSPAVSWSRTYDVGRGTSGTFNGCYGETFGPEHGPLRSASMIRRPVISGRPRWQSMRETRSIWPGTTPGPEP